MFLKIKDSNHIVISSITASAIGFTALVGLSFPAGDQENYPSQDRRPKPSLRGVSDPKEKFSSYDIFLASLEAMTEEIKIPTNKVHKSYNELGIITTEVNLKNLENDIIYASYVISNLLKNHDFSKARNDYKIDLLTSVNCFLTAIKSIDLKEIDHGFSKERVRDFNELIMSVSDRIEDDKRKALDRSQKEHSVTI